MRLEPVVYEHAAALIGETPWSVSRDKDLLFRAHATAYERYRHRNVVVGIDLYNVEAEAYGAVVSKPSGNGVPAVAEHPFRHVADLAGLSPLNAEHDGRLPLTFAAAERTASTVPEARVGTAITGPFTLASNLVGLENLLLSCIVDPEEAAASLAHLGNTQSNLIAEAIARGFAVTVFESAVAPPLLSPTLFNQLVKPALRTMIDAAHAAGASNVPLIIGGDTIHILDAMVETNADSLICPFVTDQAAFLDRVRVIRPGLEVRVNVNPQLFSQGSTDALKNAIRAGASIVSDLPNTYLGTGVLPYDALPDLVDQAVRLASTADRACT